MAGPYSSGAQTLTITYGATYSHEVANTTEFGSKVNAEISSGFNIFGLKGQAKVGAEVSATVSSTFESTFSMSETKTYQDQFDAGQVWQWQFNVTTGCGAILGEADFTGQATVLTAGLFAPPCCLPGWAMDPTAQHGQCAPGPDGNVYVLDGEGCDKFAPSALAQSGLAV